MIRCTLLAAASHLFLYFSEKCPIPSIVTEESNPGPIAKGPPLAKRSRTMDAFVDRATPEQIGRFADKCIAFFAKCNIPFKCVEDKSFYDLIHELRPNMTIPNRKEMAGPLLSKLFDKEVEKNRPKVAGSKYGTIIADGWKNMSVNRNTVVTTMGVGDEFVLLKSYDASQTSETGQYLVEVVKESQTIAQSQYGVTCNTVVTDNAANMVLMGKLLRKGVVSESDTEDDIIDEDINEPGFENADDEGVEEPPKDVLKLPDMFHSRCHAHLANLVLKEIGKYLQLSTLFDKIKPIFKEFKKPMNAAILKEEKCKVVFAPFQVRWCTYRDSLMSFTNNVEAFRRIAQRNADINSKIALIIYNDDLIQECKDAIATMDPVCKLLNEVQKNTTKVSDALENWNVLLEQSPEWLREIVMEKLKKHSVFSDEAIIANILDPKYRGKRLSIKCKQQGDDAILSRLDADGQVSYLQYEQQSGRFATLKTNVKCDLYWQLAKTGHPALAELADKFTHVPASSASLERLFSNWGYVHNKIRNRRGSQKSEKLAYIYYASR